jgi:hypothetical protein
MIFFSFVSLKKHFFKKMLGQVLVKKSSFLGATLNLHRGKTVNFFYTFSSPHDTHGQDLSNKKNRALYHACVLKYDAAKIRYFFKKGLYFGRPLYITEKRKLLSKLAFYDKIFIKFKSHTIWNSRQVLSQ